MAKRKQGKVDVLEVEEDDSIGKKSKTSAKASSKQVSLEPFVDDLGWTVVPPSLIHKDWKSKPSKKIAAFDLDGTLVNVKSGAQFPRTADDWRLFNKEVPKKLKELHEDGYKIIILSNQGGIKGALTGAMATKTKQRIEQLVEKLGLPIQVFLATSEDRFRKPEPGMWEHMCSNCNADVVPDLKKSFFVGDAAGRPADFSDSDKAFAEALKIPFKTPEEMFGEMEGKRALPMASKAGAEAGESGKNAELATVFRRLAEKFSGETFKARAFQKASGILGSYPAPITLSNLKEVGKLPGIGKGTIALITEFLSNGKVAVLEENEASATEVVATASGVQSKTVKKSAAADVALKFM